MKKSLDNDNNRLAQLSKEKDQAFNSMMRARNNSQAMERLYKGKCIQKRQRDYFKANKELHKATKIFDDLVKRLNNATTEHSKKRQELNDMIIKLAGVPSIYLDNVRVEVTQRFDTINIFFGGCGSPKGPDHGHYVMDFNGKLKYQREVGAPHGPQNHKTANYNHNSLNLSYD